MRTHMFAHLRTHVIRLGVRKRVRMRMRVRVRVRVRVLALVLATVRHVQVGALARLEQQQRGSLRWRLKVGVPTPICHRQCFTHHGALASRSAINLRRILWDVAIHQTARACARELCFRRSSSIVFDPEEGYLVDPPSSVGLSSTEQTICCIKTHMSEDGPDQTPTTAKP
eukprot:1889186-Pleurochrysis_carterae.AAC.1